MMCCFPNHMTGPLLFTADYISSVQEYYLGQSTETNIDDLLQLNYTEFEWQDDCTACAFRSLWNKQGELYVCSPIASAIECSRSMQSGGE